MGKDKSAHVVVLILHWNNASDTLRCLEAVFASHYADVQVVVVDNGSGNDSAAVIRNAWPTLTVLETGCNLGYAGGNNVGIEYALAQNADYVLLLNDDTVIEPQTVPALVEAAQVHPEAGFLGPKVYCLEEPQRLITVGGYLDKAWRPIHRGLGQWDGGQYNEITAVDFLSGSALLIRRKVIEQVGVLDPRFFAYREDVDWCYRGRQAGFKALYVPEARVWHPDTRQRDAESPLVTYYITRNSLLFAAKHRLGWRVVAQMLAGYVRTLLSWTLRPQWRHKREQRDALARAIRDFGRGHCGPM